MDRSDFKSPGFAIFRYSRAQVAGEKILYYPSCISRLLGGHTGGKKSIIDTFLSVSEKAGIQVAIPESITGSCCSQIFLQKDIAVLVNTRLTGLSKFFGFQVIRVK